MSLSVLLSVLGWLQHNWVTISAIALALVRLLQSIDVVLASGPIKSKLELVINVLKQIFNFTSEAKLLRSLRSNKK